jgi:uncharacterized protein YqgC (DUF456 family)
MTKKRGSQANDARRSSAIIIVIVIAIVIAIVGVVAPVRPSRGLVISSLLYSGAFE